MGNEEFDGLVEEFFRWTLKTHPPLATDLGLHDHDHLLPDGSREAVLEEVRTWEGYRRRFSGLDPAELSGSRPLDRELALYLLDLWVYLRGEVRLWESLPQGAEAVGDAILPLLFRDFPPSEQRFAALGARLRATPRFLQANRGLITRPAALWGEMALEASKALISFISTIPLAARESLRGPDREELEASVGAATEAVEAYGGWLKDEVVPGGSEDYSIGAKAFSKILDLRGIGMSREDVQSLAEEELRVARTELEGLARGMDPRASLEEVRERIKGDHPQNFQEVLQMAHDTVGEARESVRRKGLATMPPGETLQVMATPTYLLHAIGLGTYYGPGRWEKVRKGILFLTPPREQEGLREFNYPALKATALHEGIPGHHLQRSCANLNPSLVRQLPFRLAEDVAAAETSEGWATYATRLMLEEGFDPSLEGQFLRALADAWAACSALIDVGIHGGSLSFEEAVHLLTKEVGLTESLATEEVRGYLATPTRSLSYLVGRRSIEALKEEVRTRMGDGFSLRFFHDTILYSGNLPLTLLRKVFEDKLDALEEEPPEG